MRRRIAPVAIGCRLAVPGAHALRRHHQGRRPRQRDGARPRYRPDQAAPAGLRPWRGVSPASPGIVHGADLGLAPACGHRRGHPRLPDHRAWAASAASGAPSSGANSGGPRGRAHRRLCLRLVDDVDVSPADRRGDGSGHGASSARRACWRPERWPRGTPSPTAGSRARWRSCSSSWRRCRSGSARSASTSISASRSPSG